MRLLARLAAVGALCATACADGRRYAEVDASWSNDAMVVEASPSEDDDHFLWSFETTLRVEEGTEVALFFSREPPTSADALADVDLGACLQRPVEEGGCLVDGLGLLVDHVRLGSDGVAHLEASTADAEAEAAKGWFTLVRRSGRVLGANGAEGRVTGKLGSTAYHRVVYLGLCQTDADDEPPTARVYPLGPVPGAP